MNNKLELKTQALLERISNLTAEYENKVADLRVELTLVTQERDSLLQEVNTLRENVVQEEESTDRQS